MVRYRRNFVPGGTYFFTVTLADRRSCALVGHITVLRQVFRVARSERPFAVDAIVVLPEHLHAVLTLPPDDAAATDRPPEVVVLNSCESSTARKLVLRSAKVVVSMRVPITDVAATVFAQRFYAAIASGQSIKAAFAQGKVAVENVSISERATPELFHATSSKPEKMVLT